MANHSVSNPAPPGQPYAFEVVRAELVEDLGRILAMLRTCPDERALRREIQYLDALACGVRSLLGPAPMSDSSMRAPLGRNRARELLRSAGARLLNFEKRGGSR